MGSCTHKQEGGINKRLFDFIAADVIRLSFVQEAERTNPCSNVAPARHSRHADEGRVAPVEEGAVDHLQDEGEVLERQVAGGGAHREQHALERRDEQRQDGGPQVGLLLALTCRGTRTPPSASVRKESCHPLISISAAWAPSRDRNSCAFCSHQVLFSL